MTCPPCTYTCCSCTSHLVTSHLMTSRVSTSHLLISHLFTSHLLLVYVAPSLFCLISVVGVIGNSFVIYVIASTPHMRTSATNILLLNLAVADLYFLIVCAPFMAYKYATVSWNFGHLACKLVGFSTYTSSYVTVYTLVAISALRYSILPRTTT